MGGIRINKLCKQFGVGAKELIAFLSSKGIMASSSPNFKVSESAIPLLQKEYGYKENVEVSADSPIGNPPDENTPIEAMTESTEPIVLPDSPFRNGNTGKYKLLVKSVTELFGNYEYLLVDADGKEYKTILEQLFSAGDVLRCIVYFRLMNAKLVVESVSICKKQDLATPIPVEKKIVNDEKQVKKKENKDKNAPKVKREQYPKAKVEKTPKAKIPTKISEKFKTSKTIDEVKRILAAKENGTTVEELTYDILRLRQIIVSNKLQAMIINECGRESLLWVLSKAKKISNTRDKLNRTLRDSWIKWFNENYDVLCESNLKETPNNDKTKRIAGFIDFVEIMSISETEEVFFLNGLKACENLAKKKHFYTEPRVRNENKTYVMKASPHITRKDWGNPFRPARG